MRERVSCIVPVFDGARHLVEALDSIAAQTRPVDEVIVVDDGSTDGSAELAARHKLRPTVLRQANRGCAAARNAGLAAAAGEFIAFLDCDDLWAAEKTERQLALLRARPDLDMVLCGYVDVVDPRFGDAASTAWQADYLRHTDGRRMLLQCAMLRRGLLARCGGFDERIRRNGSDSEWFARVIERGALVERSDEVHVQRRLHDRNLTRRLDQAVLRDLSLEIVHRMIRQRRSPDGS